MFYFDIISIYIGGIELSVFSELFQIELDVVDIQTQRIDKFGIPKSITSSYAIPY